MTHYPASFKFALERSQGQVVGRSIAKEASVTQLPISKGMAGVSMTLGPGDMRELHWHATAAEWAFVDRGRVRTTVLGPGGYAETNEFEPGDVWYFPRAHGHMLECLGDEPCHFVLIFDNGYFSEFGTFSITDWVGHTPRRLLARNFGLPEATFEGFPTREVYFAHGAAPPQRPADPLRGRRDQPHTHKYRLLASPPRVNDRGGRFWLVDSRNFPISKTVAGAILELEPGAMRELYWHPSADEWQYVFEGRISITLFGANGRFRTETLEQGDVGYIPQGYGHSLENAGDRRCRILIGFNSGVYEDIDLSEWMASNPVDVLATNFGRPEALFRRFPRRDVFITERPPCPGSKAGGDADRLRTQRRGTNSSPGVGRSQLGLDEVRALRLATARSGLPSRTCAPAEVPPGRRDLQVDKTRPSRQPRW